MRTKVNKFAIQRLIVQVSLIFVWPINVLIRENLFLN